MAGKWERLQCRVSALEVEWGEGSRIVVRGAVEQEAQAFPIPCQWRKSPLALPTKLAPTMAQPRLQGKEWQEHCPPAR